MQPFAGKEIGPGENLNAPTLMIGERASDFILNS